MSFFIVSLILLVLSSYCSADLVYGEDMSDISEWTITVSGSSQIAQSSTYCGNSCPSLRLFCVTSSSCSFYRSFSGTLPDDGYMIIWKMTPSATGSSNYYYLEDGSWGVGIEVDDSEYNIVVDGSTGCSGTPEEGYCYEGLCYHQTAVSLGNGGKIILEWHKDGSHRDLYFYTADYDGSNLQHKFTLNDVTCFGSSYSQLRLGGDGNQVDALGTAYIDDFALYSNPFYINPTTPVVYDPDGGATYNNVVPVDCRSTDENPYDTLTYTVDIYYSSSWHSASCASGDCDIDTSSVPEQSNVRIRCNASDGHGTSSWAYSGYFTIQHASCTDGIKNQDETDIDCGGTICSDCANGKACLLNSDCQSNWCHNNICTQMTCSDGVQNQGETGVDCGGPCPPCETTTTTTTLPWWPEAVINLTEYKRKNDTVSFYHIIQWNQTNLNGLREQYGMYQWELRRNDTPDYWDYWGDYCSGVFYSDLPYADDTASEEHNFILLCPLRSFSFLGGQNNEEFEIRLNPAKDSLQKLKADYPYLIFVEFKRKIKNETFEIKVESEFCGGKWPLCEYPFTRLWPREFERMNVTS